MEVGLHRRRQPGSVLISFGKTKVLCTASVEAEVPRWMKDSGQGWVTAEYAMLPGSSTERVRRDHVSGGRAQEISRLIGRSLRAVVDLKALGEAMAVVDCDVIEADGGTQDRGITGAWVALHQAFDDAVDRGTDPVVAAHRRGGSSLGRDRRGRADARPGLRAGLVRAEVDMNVVM